MQTSLVSALEHRVVALQGSPVFQDFTTAEVTTFAELLEDRWFAATSRLMAQGEATCGVFLILSGKARVLRSVSHGRQATIALAGPGCLLGELAALDGSQSVKTVVAETDLHALFISCSQLARFLKEHPTAGQRFALVCAKKARQLLDALDLQKQGTIRERLAKVLLERLGANGQKSDSPTHEDLAVELGTAREVVTRTLHRMGREGLIQVNRRKIDLVNRPMLEELASQVPIHNW
jgi:CRP-like cAMP-binding protein